MLRNVYKPYVDRIEASRRLDIIGGLLSALVLTIVTLYCLS